MNQAMLTAIARAIKEALIRNKKLTIGTIVYWLVITVLGWKGIFPLIGLGLLGYLVYKVYLYVKAVI